MISIFGSLSLSLGLGMAAICITLFSIFLKNNKYRFEKDSMGSMKVPVDALYGAQTQRAIENFPISGTTFFIEFIKSICSNLLLILI